MTDLETIIMIKQMARETVRRMSAKNSRPKTDYGELLGYKKDDSPELHALRAEKGKLDIKALKAFSGSPRQKEILAERDKLLQKIKDLEEKEKRARK